MRPEIDFAQTRVERLAAGDPQLSIEERYASHRAYVSVDEYGNGKSPVSGALSVAGL